MKTKVDWEQLKKEHEEGKRYKESIHLYSDVKRNENFYVGRQWEGVKAPNLPKPVINILKRVVSYFISMLVSDDVAIHVEKSLGTASDGEEVLLQAANDEISRVVEQTKLRQISRYCLRDAAVDGDCCLHLYFDPDAETGTLTSGEIRVERVQNTNVFFGNRTKREVQSQPYIILSRAELLSEVKSKAEERGLDADSIEADDDGQESEESKRCTVLRRYWKENGTVHCCEAAGGVMLLPDTDTRLSRYPIAWMSWDFIQQSYHGQSCMTPVIQNQIDINRLFAMCLKQVRDGAFPKLIYDKRKFPRGFDNEVGKAIGVEGDIQNAFTAQTGVTEMSGQVVEMIDRLVQYTKDTMGASDAALGEIKADNTSAIIAVQKASAMPLELQKQEYYDFWEEISRNIVDMMEENYGLREVKAGDDVVTVNFDDLQQLRTHLTVDVGGGAYWSELASMVTMDNLFNKGIIDDVELYIESVPRSQLPLKQKILDIIRKRKEEEEEAAAMQLQTGGMQTGEMQLPMTEGGLPV